MIPATVVFGDAIGVISRLESKKQRPIVEAVFVVAGNEIRTHAETLEGSRATTTPYPHVVFSYRGDRI